MNTFTHGQHECIMRLALL